MNVCAELHGNASNKSLDISLKTMNVNHEKKRRGVTKATSELVYVMNYNLFSGQETTGIVRYGFHHTTPPTSSDLCCQRRV